MFTLGLDTTGPYCSVSIVDPAHCCAHISKPMQRGHAEALAPMVADALAQAQLGAADIGRVAVCTGPGSFTGQRVALSFAKAFALPDKLPVIGLSALQIWALMQDPEQQKYIISIADVRRGELCWAAFDKGELLRPPLTQAADKARRAIAELQADEIIQQGYTDTRILAWRAADLSPQDYPAVPLYARGPDAKRPQS